MFANTHRAAFWALVVVSVFGTSLQWPLFLKVVVVVLAGAVLAGVAARIYEACQKEV